MHHSDQGPGEPWRWEDKIDVHQGTNRKTEGGVGKKNLKKGEKYYLLYALVLILVLYSICIIGPFAVSVLSVF